MELYITNPIDVIPDDSPMAEGMEPVRPIWTDTVSAGIDPAPGNVSRRRGCLIRHEGRV